jgi:hypothetical protein
MLCIDQGRHRSVVFTVSGSVRSAPTRPGPGLRRRPVGAGTLPTPTGPHKSCDLCAECAYIGEFRLQGVDFLELGSLLRLLVRDALQLAAQPGELLGFSF